MVKFSVALVGRPNVGKSRLFNRLIGQRLSIVHDQPGITRDVIIQEMENGVVFMDTGGIGFSSCQEEDTVTQAVEEQINFAIRAADIIFFVVDGRAGCTPLDYEITKKLRQSSKKILLIVNKIDSERETYRSDNFHDLGFGIPISVSAEHGYGEEYLKKFIDECVDKRGGEVFSSEDDNCVKTCLAGRPNVGKSSIANALLMENRMIVSPIAGTTRDAISDDIAFENEGKEYRIRLTDTAGLREKKKMSSSVEFFSSMRSLHAIDEAHVVFLTIDALSGITRQDKKLAGYALERGKCFAIVVNKWDLACEGIKSNRIVGYHSIADFQKKFTQAIQKACFALSQFPVIFVSAKTGLAVENILREGICLFERASQTISTGKLNRVIQDLVNSQPPPLVSGKRFKIYYAVQSGHFPFQLKIFCNRFQRLIKSYRQYLENNIREAFDLMGCPLVFDFIDKEVRYTEKTA
ncbi:MAG: ribosome biogenesis GTPase Der [Puniceicoccales bacterium]|jgi:GTP-binding protein|nr:ribosome biogenesis GTPase Der [Puniceicoccales bacterium]